MLVILVCIYDAWKAGPHSGLNCIDVMNWRKVKFRNEIFVYIYIYIYE